MQNRNKTSFPRRRESRRVLRALPPDSLDARFRGHDERNGSLSVTTVQDNSCANRCRLETKRHSRAGGNPDVYLRRVRRTRWMPAFAGMTKGTEVSLRKKRSP